MNRMMMINGAVDELYDKDRLLQSEYFFSLYVREFLLEQNKPCQFCGSNNLEVSNINYDGRKVLVGLNTEQFQLVIMKKNDGEVQIKSGGSTYIPMGFLKSVYFIIEDIVKKTPTTEFEPKPIENVRFVVSTGFVGNNDFRTDRLEQFSFVGFGKDELIEILQKIKPQMIDR